MKAPAGNPGDFGIAQCAEPTLFIVGGIVRVRFALDLDVSFDGSALGVE